MQSVIQPETILVDDGTVTLGLPHFPAGSRVPHVWEAKKIHVPSFRVAMFAVTVAEVLAFAKATNYPIADELRNDSRFRDQSAPAAFVSWIDATRYAQWLARRTGRQYRLLRDAEYEKAARGGILGAKYPWGDDPPWGRADFNNPTGSPLPVGSFAPNGYGMHDMAGSMWSWCEECFDEVAAPDTSRMIYDDTRLRDVRLNAVCRGGSYKTSDPTVLFCAYRHEDPIDGRFDCIGFRLALAAD
jgi:formylglycine-generating enzyme required for sulfatase activity